MKKIKLHYAKIDLGEQDIPVIEFENVKSLTMWAATKFAPIIPLETKSEIVYLVTFEDKWRNMDHVFVTEYGGCISNFIHSFSQFAEISDIHIQEYESYEEAYKVALMMKEISPMCYTKTPNLN
jgi:hypothetical protein